MTVAGLIIYLGLLPILGYLTSGNMRALLLSDTPPSRQSLYVNALVSQWVLVFLVLIGMKTYEAPVRPLGLHLDLDGRVAWAFAAVLVVYGGMRVLRARAEGSGRLRDWLLRHTPAAVRRVAPTTPAELRLFAPVALTTGVCEEILFRGVPFHMLADLPVWLILAITAVSFATLHLYQGRIGTLATGLAGLIFGGLFLFADSLLPVMALHALYNWEIGRLHVLLTESS